MLEIQTAALVIIAFSIGFYVLDKKIIFNSKCTKKEKQLEQVIQGLNKRLKNYDRTVDNMNNYQEKYKDMLVKNSKLQEQITNFKKSHLDLLNRINRFNTEQYEKGLPCQA